MPVSICFDRDSWCLQLQALCARSEGGGGNRQWAQFNAMKYSGMIIMMHMTLIWDEEERGEGNKRQNSEFSVLMYALLLRRIIITSKYLSHSDIAN